MRISTIRAQTLSCLPKGKTRTFRIRKRSTLQDEASFRSKAAEIYELYATQYKKRFKWLRPDLFVAQLKKDLADR